MGFWNTRGLRGSSLETLINFTNDFYRQKGLALFQKIPTPITPVKVNNEKRRMYSFRGIGSLCQGPGRRRGERQEGPDGFQK